MLGSERRRRSSATCGAWGTRIVMAGCVRFSLIFRLETEPELVGLAECVGDSEGEFLRTNWGCICTDHGTEFPSLAVDLTSLDAGLRCSALAAAWLESVRISSRLITIGELECWRREVLAASLVCVALRVGEGIFVTDA